MTATVVNVRIRGARTPRAVQIPANLTDDDVDHVLYGFGFEYFGPSYGTQRLVHLSDDMIGDYDDAAEVMRAAGAELALFDRYEARWVPLLPGDWVIEPCDGVDGFIRCRSEQFADTWEVVS